MMEERKRQDWCYICKRFIALKQDNTFYPHKRSPGSRCPGIAMTSEDTRMKAFPERTAAKKG